jgi:3-isopropylmalate/(R)-2-methylmalate dehydratase small subunit
MKAEYTGAAWRFGDDVTTDDILPGQFLDRANSEVGQFAFAGLNPAFALNVQSGDLVVAGKNFGVGSGRESAVFAIQEAGVAVVIAESFARLFFRNAINNGLIPVMIEDSAAIEQDHRVMVDIANRLVTDLTTNRSHPIVNLTGISRDILDAGGIVPFIERRMANKLG